VHGEPWWNDIDRGELLFSLPELSGIPTSSHVIVKQELAKETEFFALRSIFVHTWKGSLTFRKILRHGAKVLLHL
jgi:hypothetical protein